MKRGKELGGSKRKVRDDGLERRKEVWKTKVRWRMGREERSEGSKRSQRKAREERIAGQTTGEFLGSLRGKYRVRLSDLASLWAAVSLFWPLHKMIMCVWCQRREEDGPEADSFTRSFAPQLMPQSNMCWVRLAVCPLLFLLVTIFLLLFCPRRTDRWVCLMGCRLASLENLSRTHNVDAWTQICAHMHRHTLAVLCGQT